MLDLTTSSALDAVLHHHQIDFASKVHGEESQIIDPLMQIFSIDQTTKQENKQYWGSQLGRCWESLVVSVGKTSTQFSPAVRYGRDEPCDFVLGNDAIDVKYRIGSGDSGTLKKFRANGRLLRESGYTTVLLVLRTDNLSAAVRAHEVSGWQVYIGDESFTYLLDKTGIDLATFLGSRVDRYPIRA